MNDLIVNHSDEHVTSYISFNDVVMMLPYLNKKIKKYGYGLHFIHGTNQLYIVLSLLFNAMIVHGYSPDGLSISTIQPLVKNKRKSLSDSSNFRVISLSSPVAKIFDWVILNSNTENPMTIRCLLYIANQRLNITWNIYVTVCQTIFRHQMVPSKVVSYILSPILFGIYIDEMLLRLSQFVYGCIIGHL